MLQHEWDQRSVDFPLTVDSVVLDIGGYKGRWAKEIAQRYGSHIYVFEPQLWAAAIAREELKEFPSVQVFEYGLGVERGTFEMEEFETDGATFMRGRSQRQQSGEGNLLDMEIWLGDYNISQIDLIMLNVEGYEFKLIPYMLEKGILQNVKYFMCQFHPHGYEQEEEYEVLRKQLGEVMDVYFDYGIVLMCWKAKEKAEGRTKQKAVEHGESVAKGIETGLVKGPIPEVEKPKKPKSTRGRKKKAAE